MSGETEDPLRSGERRGDEMEERLEALGDDIDTARAQARNRQEEADPEGVAGDWEEESEGAQQGDDATEVDDRE